MQQIEAMVEIIFGGKISASVIKTGRLSNLVFITPGASLLIPLVIYIITRRNRSIASNRLELKVYLQQKGIRQMSVRYTLSGNLFRVNLEGSYTPEEMKKTFMKALNDPLFPEDARFLLDVRKSSELSERSYNDIKSVAQFFAAHSDRVSGRCAIVADKEVHYGLSRMGATLAQIKGARIEVFRDINEAILWIGGDPDQPDR